MTGKLNWENLQHAVDSRCEAVTQTEMRQSAFFLGFYILVHPDPDESDWGLWVHR